jgi:hypothetical protein
MAANREAIMEMVERAQRGSDEIRADLARRRARSALFLDRAELQPREEAAPTNEKALGDAMMCLAAAYAEIDKLRAEIDALKKGQSNDHD